MSTHTESSNDWSHHKSCSGQSTSRLALSRELSSDNHTPSAFSRLTSPHVILDLSDKNAALPQKSRSCLDLTALSPSESSGQPVLMIPGWSYDAIDSDDVTKVRSVELGSTSLSSLLLSSSSSMNLANGVEMQMNGEASDSAEMSCMFSQSSSSCSDNAEPHSDEDEDKVLARSPFAPSPENATIITKSGRQSRRLVDLTKAKRITKQAIMIEEAQEQERNANKLLENSLPHQGEVQRSNERVRPKKTPDWTSIVQGPRKLLDLTLRTGPKKRHMSSDNSTNSNAKKKIKSK